jgi:competence protein ComEA
MKPLLSTLRRYFLLVTLVLTLAPSIPYATALQAPTPPATDNAAKLDLNTATADQLKSLPGIGDAYAKRIIDGRPYTAKNQLTSRGILPQKTYDTIKDKIIAHRPTAR